jgi:hypothetical protein
MNTLYGRVSSAAVNQRSGVGRSVGSGDVAARQQGKGGKQVAVRKGCGGKKTLARGKGMDGAAASHAAI